MLLRTHTPPYGNNFPLSPSPVVSSTVVFILFRIFCVRRVPRTTGAAALLDKSIFFDLTYTVPYRIVSTTTKQERRRAPPAGTIYR